MADKENSPPRKKTNKYLCKFNEKMTQEHSDIRRSKKGETFAFCVTCHMDISVGNRGKTDVKKRVGNPTHKKNARTVQSATYIYNSQHKKL